MDRLNLDPPTSLFESIANDARVVAIANYKFVTVLYICILERYLGNSTLENVCVATFARFHEALLSRLLMSLQLHCIKLVRKLLGDLVLQLH